MLVNLSFRKVFCFVFVTKCGIVFLNHSDTCRPVSKSLFNRVTKGCFSGFHLDGPRVASASPLSVGVTTSELEGFVSALKTYNFPSHKGFCHNFPTARYYHKRKKMTNNAYFTVLQNSTSTCFPFFIRPIVKLCCICIKLDRVLVSKSPNR